MVPWLKSKVPASVVDPDTWVDMILSWMHPNWEHNATEGHEVLDQYNTGFLEDLGEEGKNQ